MKKSLSFLLLVLIAVTGFLVNALLKRRELTKELAPITRQQTDSLKTTTPQKSVEEVLDAYVAAWNQAEAGRVNHDMQEKVEAIIQGMHDVKALQDLYTKARSNNDNELNENYVMMLVERIATLSTMKDAMSFFAEELEIKKDIDRWIIEDVLTHSKATMAESLAIFDTLSEERQESHRGAYIKRLEIHDFTTQEIVSYLNHKICQQNIDSTIGTLEHGYLQLSDDEAGRKKFQILLQAASLLDPKDRAKFTLAMASGNLKTQPFETWKMTQDLLGKSDLTPAQNSEMRRRMSLAMIAENPERAMQTMLSDKSIAANENAAMGLRHWATTNYKDVEKYIASGKIQMTPLLTAALEAGRATSLFDNERFGEALNLLEKLPDENMQDRFIGEFYTLETWRTKEHLRHAGNTPDKMVNDIAAGRSHFSNRALEIAMTQWISSDPLAAENWYHNNAERLPKKNAQYVASAYALEAVRQGDLESAKRWAESIEDRITLNRVNAEIKKKSGN